MPNLSFFFVTGVALRLNILSIRSVITKPPTTLVVEQTTAMKPRIALTVV